MKQPDSISIKFDDAIEMLENLEYFLHKQLPEGEEEKILKIADSLRARIQIHKALANFYDEEEN